MTLPKNKTALHDALILALAEADKDSTDTFSFFVLAKIEDVLEKEGPLPHHILEKVAKFCDDAFYTQKHADMALGIIVRNALGAGRDDGAALTSLVLLKSIAEKNPSEETLNQVVTGYSKLLVEYPHFAVAKTFEAMNNHCKTDDHKEMLRHHFQTALLRNVDICASEQNPPSATVNRLERTKSEPVHKVISNALRRFKQG